MRRVFVFLCLLLLSFAAQAEDGYRLWLRYDKIDDAALLQQYGAIIKSVYFNANSPVLASAKQELLKGLQGLLDKKILATDDSPAASIFVLSAQGSTARELTIEEILKRLPNVKLEPDSKNLGSEGFSIRSVFIEKKSTTFIEANTDVGCLYGVFHFLRLLQTHQSIQNLNITSVPKIQNRILNHWDNLNRHVERGYAGLSIFNWHQLPGYIDQRYTDYARANASIGINGTVLTNVNANALVLTKEYLLKVKGWPMPFGLTV